MGALESNSGDNTKGPLFDCTYGYLNTNIIFFSGEGVYNNIVHQKHSHEDIIYYHDTYVIGFNNHFKILTELISCTGCNMLGIKNNYTILHSNQ